MLRLNKEVNEKETFGVEDEKPCEYCHFDYPRKMFSEVQWNKRNKKNRCCKQCFPMRALCKRINRRNPSNLRFANGIYEKDEMINKYVLQTTKWPVMLGEGQFRLVYGANIVSGKLDHWMQADSHIVIKKFNDKYFEEGYRHTDLDIKQQDLAIKYADEYSTDPLVVKHFGQTWLYYRKSYLYCFPANVYDKDDETIFYKNDPVVLEGMIHKDYEKYNSNTGWSKEVDYLEAFSHWSYHKYGVLLCDLQGHKGKHIYDRPKGKKGHFYYLLTDPCIHTPNREFGLSDLGQDGISNFFYHHKCNNYCKLLKKPEEIKLKYRKQQSTSFEKPFTGEFSNVRGKANILRDLTNVSTIQELDEEDEDYYSSGDEEKDVCVNNYKESLKKYIK